MTLEWLFDEARQRRAVAMLAETSHLISPKSELSSSTAPLLHIPSLPLSNSFAPRFAPQSGVTVESRQCRVTLVFWDRGREHPGQRESQ